MAAKARDIMEVHRMLVHPNQETTKRKMTEAMRIVTMSQWGPCKACLQVKAKRYAMPKMTIKRANVK